MIIHLLTLVDGSPHEYSDTYVVEYDPAFHLPSGEYDGGMLRVTRDPRKAKKFDSFEEAARYWQQSHGLRDDGQPNRPLTAFNVEIS